MKRRLMIGLVGSLIGHTARSAQEGRIRAGETPALPRKGTVQVLLHSSFEPASLDDMVRHASVVVTGAVARVHPSRFTDERSLAPVETDVEITIETVLKGAVTRRALIVAQGGGDIGDLHVVVQGDTRMAPGERYVLCLNPDRRTGLPDLGRMDRFGVAGLFSGRFLIDGRGKVQAHALAPEVLRSLAGKDVNEFLGLVRRAVADERR